MIPKYQVDLDLPPIKRWEFLHQYTEQAQRIIPELLQENTNGRLYQGWARKLVRNRNRHINEQIKTAKTASTQPKWMQFYLEELQAVAEILEMSQEDLILMQLVYQACSGCTCLIYPDPSAKSSHQPSLLFYRTMDWSSPLLRELTINLEVNRGGQLLYRSTTWVGYMGVVTAMMPHKFALAANYRANIRSNPRANMNNSGPRAHNMNESTGLSYYPHLDGLIKGYWPIGYFLRYLIESTTSDTSDTSDMLKQLETVQLIAPVYFILLGNNSHEAYIVSRTPSGLACPTRSIIGENYLIQTNIDGPLSENAQNNVLWSIEREELITRLYPKLAAGENVWNVMAKWPIVNHESIYATMISTDKDYWESRLIDMKRNSRSSS